LNEHCVRSPHWTCNSLKSDIYLNFLANALSQFLEPMPLAERLLMWYMHDEASAHFMCNVGST